jgi:subtilisin family serine protease
MEALGLFPSLRYPDDPLYDKQWNLHTVDAPAGWRAGGGVGVTVAVIDTGVSRVPDLGGTVVLEPSNPTMEPMVFDPADVEVYGKVVITR